MISRDFSASKLKAFRIFQKIERVRLLTSSVTVVVLHRPKVSHVKLQPLQLWKERIKKLLILQFCKKMTGLKFFLLNKKFRLQLLITHLTLRLSVFERILQQNAILTMNLIFISRVSWNRDNERYRSKF